MELNKTYKIKTSSSIYTATIIKYEKPFVTIVDKFGKEITLNENDILKYYEA